MWTALCDASKMVAWLICYLMLLGGVCSLLIGICGFILITFFFEGSYMAAATMTFGGLLAALVGAAGCQTIE